MRAEKENGNCARAEKRKETARGQERDFYVAEKFSCAESGEKLCRPEKKLQWTNGFFLAVEGAGFSAKDEPKVNPLTC